MSEENKSKQDQEKSFLDLLVDTDLLIVDYFNSFFTKLFASPRFEKIKLLGFWSGLVATFIQIFQPKLGDGHQYAITGGSWVFVFALLFYFERIEIKSPGYRLVRLLFTFPHILNIIVCFPMALLFGNGDRFYVGQVVHNALCLICIYSLTETYKCMYNE
jgi:hypothetical protein